MNTFEVVGKVMQVLMPVMSEIQVAMEDKELTAGETLDIAYNAAKESMNEFGLTDKVIYDANEKKEEKKDDEKKEEEIDEKKEDIEKKD